MAVDHTFLADFSFDYVEVHVIMDFGISCKTEIPKLRLDWNIRNHNKLKKSAFIDNMF